MKTTKTRQTINNSSLIIGGVVLLVITLAGMDICLKSFLGIIGFSLMLGTCLTLIIIGFIRCFREDKKNTTG